MQAESENYEEKSRYSGEDKQRVQILKTIIAIANSGGGQIRILEVTAGFRALDSASLDSTVNAHVGPQLYGLSSRKNSEGEVIIDIPDSANAPHITTKNATYIDQKGKTKYAFYRGQIWVRHGSQNELANGDDLHRLTQKKAGHLLQELGTRVQQGGLILDAGHPDATPVRLGGDSSALRVHADLHELYPHTRKSLSEELDKPTPWIIKAVKSLGLEDKIEWAHSEINSAGKPIFWRYSDDARAVLLDKLEDDPSWHP